MIKQRAAWVVAICLGLAGSAMGQIAFDEGANYVGGWTDGSNGGSGFEAWGLTATGGVSGFAGQFVGDPADANITGMATDSFGLFANSDAAAFSQADRNFSAPLNVGESFSFQWGVNFDSGAGGNKGFNLYAGGAGSNQLFNVNNAGSSAITLDGADIGFGYGTTAMTWSVTLADTNVLVVSANDRDGAGTFWTRLAVDAAPDAFRFYASNLQTVGGVGSEPQPYLNAFTIDVAPLFFADAETAPSALTNYLFTLQRGDTNSASGPITVTSSDTNVVTVTSEPLTFAPDATSLVFTGAVVSLTNGTATLTASTTNDVAVSVVLEPVDPVLTLDGPSFITAGGKAGYALTRTGSVSDSITLSNANTNVATLVTNVVFGAGETSVVVPVTAVATGQTTIAAIAANASAGPLTVDVIAAPTNTFDEAAFYDGFWFDGDNRGTGFGDWVLGDNDDSGLGRVASAYINQDQTNFALVAHGGGDALADAIRPFDDLAVGDSVQTRVKVNFRNGSKGVQFWSFGPGGTNQLVEFGVYADNYYFENKQTGSGAEELGWGFASDTEVIVTLSRQDTEFYSVQLERLGSAPQTNVYDNIQLTSVPNAIRYYIFNADNGDLENQLLFDELEVFTGTVGSLDPLLELSGPSFVIDGGIATYSLTRNSAVDATVTLSNSAPALLSVTNAVTFGASEYSLTFKVSATATGLVELVAADTNTATAPLSIEVRAAPTNNVDEAANYDGFWFDGDNSGKGFAPWTLVEGGGGFFIGSSAEGGARSNTVDGAGVAFGMFNGDGGTATEAIRPVGDGTWLNGSSLSLDYSFRFDDGNRGVTVHDASLAEIGYFNISNTGYDFNGTAASSTVFVGEREFGEVLTFTFTQNGANLDWTVTGVHPSSPDVSGTIANQSLGAVRVYSAAGSTGSGNDAFFNNFALTEGSGPIPVAPEISGFSITNGQPQVGLSGVAGTTYTLVYTTNLLEITTVTPPELSEWVAVTSQVPLVDGAVLLLDTNALTDAARFYGVLTGPLD